MAAPFQDSGARILPLRCGKTSAFDPDLILGNNLSVSAKTCSTLDFGISTSELPDAGCQPIWLMRCPMTLGLMMVSLRHHLLRQAILLGALMVWERTPRLWKVAIPAAMVFLSVPPILSGLLPDVCLLEPDPALPP